MGVVMFTLENVNQTTPVEGATAAGAVGVNTISTSVNVDNNDLVMYVALSGGPSSTWTPGAGFTESYDVSLTHFSYEVVTQLRTSAGLSMPSAINSAINQLNMLGFEINASSAALPITLLSFDVNKVNQTVHLMWTSLSEKNNDYYSVEHSTDGINWKSIATVDGAIYSNQKLEYNVVHNDPPIGLNYYRLKQTDIDGQFEYFDVKLLEFGSENELFTIFPNPANEDMYIDLNLAPVNVKIEIYDAKGNLVWSGAIQNSNFDKRIKISTKQFSSGLYTVSISDQFKLFKSKRILISH
jgi:hypothetical protein